MKDEHTIVSARWVFTDPILFVAFGFGSGLAPKAPGTAGTLVAIPIYLLLANTPLLIYLGLTIFLALLGFWICGSAAERLGVHDHGGIVWDEIVGFLVTMSFVEPSIRSILAGFVLFRLFDIIKPWPIRAIDQQVKGGAGIVLDDVLAGVYAAIMLVGFQYLDLLE